MECWSFVWSVYKRQVRHGVPIYGVREKKIKEVR